MRRIILATKNPGKVREIEELLKGLCVEVVSSAACPNLPEAAEDGETFEENAAKKALMIVQATGELALSDDSGLEVDALGGAPGVHSARFAGARLPRGRELDRANCEKLLRLMKDVTGPSRTARFRCVVAIATPDGEVRLADGVCSGRIAFGPSGSGGFGYDPVFVPDGYDSTFAELPLEVKNAISHRGRAFRAALPLIESCLRRE